LRGLPWEETDRYIRSGHVSPDKFEENSFRTIVLSEKEGIKAIIGKLKGGDTTQVQSYLFDKSKGWTVEKAKEWFEKHHKEDKRERFSVVFPILEKIVDKPLKIKGIAITAGISRNFNIYLEEELASFAEKLKGAPVYLEHVTAENAVGKVINAWWDPQSKAVWYEAEIYDDEVQNKIRKGLIQHVSVGADYERIDILDGRVPHGLHNAELSLVAVPGIPQTNIQILEKLQEKGLPLKAAALVNDFKVEGKEFLAPGEYILGFHRDPYAFLPEHFSTIWLDRENGVLAVVGRLRTEPEKRRIQAILFSKTKMWDENKIRDWFLMHPHYLIEKAAEGFGNSISEPPKQPEKAKEMSEQNQTKQEPPKCPPGQVWDEEQQKCVEEKPKESKKILERVWTRRYINDLPDSAFAIILPGGQKDEEGKTTPRSLRKFPHHDKNGRIDLPHLRNANARVPQSDLTQEQKEQAMRHLARHKKALGIGMSAEEKKLLEQAEGEQGETEEVEFEVAPEPTMDELIASIEEIVAQINDAIDSLSARIEKLEKANNKPEGNIAEKVLKNSAEPMIPVREAIKMVESVLPTPMVERSWSLGPQRLCQELRGVIFKLRKRLKENE